MRVETEWFDYETDDRDAEIARNLKEVASATRDLATYVAGETRQACHNCGKTRACRPLALQDERGEPTLAPVCAGCQETLAEQRMEMARQRQDADQIVADARAEAEQIVEQAREQADHTPEGMDGPSVSDLDDPGHIPGQGDGDA